MADVALNYIKCAAATETTMASVAVIPMSKRSHASTATQLESSQQPKPPTRRESDTMIGMSKKYRTRDGRDVRILCVDGPEPFSIIGIIKGAVQPTCWHDQGGSPAAAYSMPINEGESPDDLFEVVPDVVKWRRIFSDDSSDVSYKSLSALRADLPTMPLHIAILRTAIKNGGKSHADVTVEVLPVDYQESAP